jgi:hypothetical protein
MGRKQLWKHMNWDTEEKAVMIGIRIPIELQAKLKEIALKEGTTISFLLRRQLISLIRKKCRDHKIEGLRLPRYIYSGPKKYRPKKNKSKLDFGTEIEAAKMPLDRIDRTDSIEAGKLVAERQPEDPSQVAPLSEAIPLKDARYTPAKKPIE